MRKLAALIFASLFLTANAAGAQGHISTSKWSDMVDATEYVELSGAYFEFNITELACKVPEWRMWLSVSFKATMLATMSMASGSTIVTAA